MNPRRRRELVLAGTAIATFAALLAFTLLWHFVYDDAPMSLPPPIDLSGRWSAFTIYPWADLVLSVLGLLALAIVATRFLQRVLLLGVLLGTVVVFLPFFSFTVPRIDRIRGWVEEPMYAFRLLATLVVVTVVAHALLIVATSSRHTPQLTRGLARGAMAVTCGLYLQLFWLCLVFPVTNDWTPADWSRPDLLRPFRPCRGAMLWDDRIGIGRVDDLWTDFQDPRGRTQPAVSIEGTFRAEYFWLTLPEAAQLRVRADDPAVMRCDGRWRREPVQPAAWHKLGAAWHDP